MHAIRVMPFTASSMASIEERCKARHVAFWALCSRRKRSPSRETMRAPTWPHLPEEQCGGLPICRSWGGLQSRRHPNALGRMQPGKSGCQRTLCISHPSHKLTYRYIVYRSTSMLIFLGWTFPSHGASHDLFAKQTLHTSEIFGQLAEVKRPRHAQCLCVQGFLEVQSAQAKIFGVRSLSVQAILSDTPNKCHSFDFTDGTFYKVDHDWLVLHFLQFAAA